ncbi:MAG: AEC family transporter [Rhizobiales bacterium]|nr:AEC family transporter [Hyphomicrobiales bacterium]
MIEILNSLIPVFAVIALGFAMKRMDFPGEALWLPLDRVTYYIFFPALLLHTLAIADLGTYDTWPMALALMAGMLSMVVVLMIVKQLVPMTGPEFSSVFQGAARWNSFVALAAIASFYGHEGVMIAAVAFAVLVPLANILSVTILTRYAGDTPAGFAAVLRLLSRNPLIIACALGIVLNVTGIGLPGPIEPSFDILGKAALTIGLLAVGAGLRPGHAVEQKWIVLLTSGLKLILMPAMMMGWCFIFGVTGLPRLVVLFSAIVPGASSSYILARQLGGDATLMATLITGGTVLAALTMPLMLWVFG